MSENRPKPVDSKKLLIVVIIAIVFAGVGTIVLLELDNYAKNDPYSENYEVGQYECDGWIVEGQFLVRKNHPITNMKEWSDEDQTKMIDLENKVLLHCGTSKVDVIENLPLCMETYVIIKDLLDRMVEMEVQSLSEADQEEYYNNYQKYFSNNCELLQEDIDLILAEPNQ